jgi:HD superfamily phosphodiesterase
MNLYKAKNYIIERLKLDLPGYLTYHGFHHTWDVYEMVTEIAQEEGIKNEEDLIILKTAALFHDAGFLSTYEGHEDAGCKLIREVLPEFEYNDEEIRKVCMMIQATKIPQSPKTHLEEILADADLDYLGRDDFYSISNSLYEEFKTVNLVNSIEDWNRIQVDFLEQHRYFTKTNISKRKAEKEKRLSELKELIKSYE